MMQFLLDLLLILVYSGIGLLLIIYIWRFWKLYINQKHMNKVAHDTIMLEIKLPREINKSPLAMEMIVPMFLQTGGVGKIYHRNWLGNLPIQFSLEIASIEGVIHFYIRTQKKFRELIESNIYAHYPGVEVVEAEDYTSLVHYTHLSKDVDLWGNSFILAKTWTPTNEKTGEDFKDEKGEKIKMPADFLPLKTYVDYGLDKDPKEEYKNDPIVPLLEFMGSIGKGEYAWYQILIQDEADTFNDKKFSKTFVNSANHAHLSLSDMAEQRKKQIRTSHWVKEGDPFKDDYGVTREKKSGEKDKDGKDIMIPALYPETKAVSKKDMELTPEEKDEIEAINKKISKPCARCVIRILYLKKEGINPGHIQNVLNVLKPFGGSNSFKPKTFSAPYDYPWEDGKNRTPWRKEEIFEAYVEREGFFPHIGERKNLDKIEDYVFKKRSMRTRKTIRMIIESLFYPLAHPSADEVMVLNAEEIATLYHFPGQVASVPTLPRIDSAKGVAPSNLPR